VLPPLLVKVPPAPPSLQTAEVAPPPKVPPNEVVVPPWQMAGTPEPTLTVGLGLTVNVLEADVLPHEPPAVVKVNVTGEPEDADEVYVVVPGVDPPLFVKIPPAPPSLHTADVAPPPNEPPKATVVPPWHIAAKAEPTLTVGLGLTVNVLLAEVVPHKPPDVVRVKVTEAGALAGAV
jgi:hypothetical protein